MCVVHNTVLRGLNSIYVQGPNVKPAEYIDFIGYSLCWHSVIHEHHTSEEDQFFPEIEEAIGEKGLLDSNVDEHSKQDKFCSKLSVDISYLELLKYGSFVTSYGCRSTHIFLQLLYQRPTPYPCPPFSAYLPDNLK